MVSSVRDRVLRGAAAGALGPVITILIQVLSVPIFLHFWGTKLYGEWLIISAVPTYLGLSDLGFGNVAGSEMTMLVAAGDRRGALRIFQSTWVLITGVSLLVALLASVCVWFLPLNRWFSLTVMSPWVTALTSLLLALYVILGMQGPVLLGGYRCEGNFPVAMLLTNILRFADNGALIVALFVGAGPIGAAAACLGTRFVGLLIFYRVLRAKSPWIRAGWEHATATCLRRLFRPAMAYMAFPAGYAITLQGTVVLIGVVLGPVSVVIFSTLRTLTRAGYQVTEIIRGTVWAEISAAFGAQNYELARRLHRYACQASLWLCGAGMGALFIVGPWLYRLWIRGKVPMDLSTFHWLLLVIIANSFWHTSSVVPMATNTHERIALGYLASAALSLPLAYVLIQYYGLPGVAMALLVADLLVGWYVLRTSLAVVKDRAVDFLFAMLDFGAVLATVRRPPGVAAPGAVAR